MIKKNLIFVSFLNIFYWGFLTILTFFIFSLVLGYKASATEFQNVDPNDYVVNTLKDGVYGITDLYDVVDIQVQGDYLYATSSTDHSFTIIDISTPTNPSQSGVVSTAYPSPDYLQGAGAFVVDGNYAYIVSYRTSHTSSTLVVVDVATKSNPSIVGHIDIDRVGASPVGYTLYKSGSYVYVTSESTDKISVIDVSAPSSPSLATTIVDGVGGFDELDNVSSLFISGDYLYAGSTHDEAVTIIDISTPSTPTEIAIIHLQTDPGPQAVINSIVVEGDYLHIVGGYLTSSTTPYSYNIYDISNPSAPTLASENSMMDLVGNSHYGYEITIDSDIARITDEAGSAVIHINIEDRSDPQTIMDMRRSNDVDWPMLTTRDLASANNYVYVSNFYSGSYNILVLGPGQLEKPHVYDLNLFQNYKPQVTGVDYDFDYYGGYRIISGSHLLPVDSTKSYKIRGEFRGAQSGTQSIFSFGFAEYDQQRAEITPQRVERISPVADAVTFNKGLA